MRERVLLCDLRQGRTLEAWVDSLLIPLIHIFLLMLLLWTFAIINLSEYNLLLGLMGPSDESLKKHNIYTYMYIVYKYIYNIYTYIYYIYKSKSLHLNITIGLTLKTGLTSQNGHHQKIYKFWRGCGEKGILLHCCGNVNWYSHYGEQYGHSLKTRIKTTIWLSNPTNWA